MANTKLTFLGSGHSEGHEMQCYLNINNDIYIVIEEENSSPVYITLDKPTAIKFAKTLRTEINKIQEGGSNE